MDAIYTLLNPPTHLGNVEGTADDRSIVCITGQPGEPQALVFICFDLLVKLEELKAIGEKGCW